MNIKLLVKRVLRQKHVFEYFYLPLRRLIYGGPWQSMFIKLSQGRLRHYEPSKYRQDNANSNIVFEKNQDERTRHLKLRHYLTGFSLTPILIKKIKNEVAHLKCEYLRNPHEQFDSILDLANDPQILALASDYLNKKPILHSSYYVNLSNEDKLSRDHTFHRDYPDFLSLSLMVYLTDVREDSGAHQIIPNSFSPNKFYNLFNRKKDADQINTQSAISITGNQGTAFMENLQLMHRRIPCKKQRQAIFINYTLQRTPP